MKHSNVIAKAVVKNSEGKILLIRRSETDERRPLQWDLPGGFVEDDENFVEAAARETFEETGITIDAKDLHLAHTLTENVLEKGNTCWLTFIGELEGVPDVTLSFEHSEHAWMTLDEALAEITYDRQIKSLSHIRDAKLFD